MGFLGEIERRKQQQIQGELVQKAYLEHQQQFAAQKAAKEIEHQQQLKIQNERDAMSYIKERLTIAGVFNQMNEGGYKGYFENVSKISGFDLGIMIYANTYLDPESDEPSVVRELKLQKADAQLKMEKAYSQYGALGHDLSVLWGILPPPSVIFFGDEVAGQAEPREIGIGIRFLKHVETKKHRNLLLEILNLKHEYLSETWIHAVYIRLNADNRATITGSNQRQVDLRELRLFDEVLGQAIHNPATLHTGDRHTWYPRSPDYGPGPSERPGDCLPGDTFISVSSGSTQIKNLKSGDLVWTVDRFGNKVKAVIVQKTKRRVSKDHKVVYVVLEDGRELIASPGHPTIENREIGNLLKGQILDKSQIVSVQIMPYKEKYTYDILPSGDTGGYWANNILIGSTLSDGFKKRQEEKKSLFPNNYHSVGGGT